LKQNGAMLRRRRGHSPREALIFFLLLGIAATTHGLEAAAKSPPRLWRPLAKSLGAASLAAMSLAAPLSGTGEAAAAEKRSIGAIAGSGLLFKDRLVVEAFEDPRISGVTVYLSDFERPITDRLQKDFFSDPSQAGLTCARRATLAVKGDLPKSPDGEEIISEARSLLFKTIKVRRVYDADQNTAVYVAFSTRLNKDDDANKARFSSSLCAVPLD